METPSTLRERLAKWINSSVRICKSIQPSLLRSFHFILLSIIGHVFPILAMYASSLGAGHHKSYNKHPHFVV